MTIAQQPQVKDARAIVEEELKHLSAGQLSAAVRGAARVFRALGIIEIVFGAAALFTPAFSGPFFVLLLGGAVLVSGMLNIVGSVELPSAGRAALGIVSAVAGLLILGHPLFGLAFLPELAGAYLIAAGIARFLEPARSALSVVNAIVGIVFGIVVFLSLSSVSPVLLGLLAGINLIVNGIQTTSTGATVRRAA